MQLKLFTCHFTSTQPKNIILQTITLTILHTGLIQFKLKMQSVFCTCKSSIKFLQGIVLQSRVPHNLFAFILHFIEIPISRTVKFIFLTKYILFGHSLLFSWIRPHDLTYNYWSWGKDATTALAKRYGPTLTSFCSFLSFSQYNDKIILKFQCKWKKGRWCAWDSNPVPEDVRHRRSYMFH